MPESAQGQANYFYALELRTFTRNRTYRVYVCDKKLVGAYMAGEVHNELSAQVMFHQIWPLMAPFVRRWLAKRKELEAYYDTLDPWSPETLRADTRNFELPRNHVLRSNFRRDRSWLTPDNYGRIDFELLDGSRRRLLVLGPDDQEAVIALLQVFDPKLVLSGQYRPVRKPAPKTPEQLRKKAIGAHLMLLLVGAVFLAFALSTAAKRKPWIPAAMLAAAAIGLLPETCSMVYEGL
ncbi:MAG: hypothetical protein U0836_19525 [Pirellulales bacterium]